MVKPVLASDAEREACALRLRDAAAEGRLGVPELEQRLGAAYTARTHADLETLTTDLPRAPERRPDSRRRAPVGARPRLVACAAAANASLMGLWMADAGAMRDPVILGIDGFQLPWPLIPAVAWAGVAAALAWRRRRGADLRQDLAATASA